jgi:hypothetical protein
VVVQTSLSQKWIPDESHPQSWGAEAHFKKFVSSNAGCGTLTKIPAMVFQTLFRLQDGASSYDTHQKSNQ